MPTNAVGFRGVAMWVHGHAVSAGGSLQTEPGGGACSLYRQGWASRFTLDRRDSAESQSRWFQIAIPTPVHLGGVPLALDTVTILFRTKDDATGIAGIDLWNGPQIVDWSFPEPAEPLSGDYRRPREKNTWRPRSPDAANAHLAIDYGLGVSVKVLFGDVGSWIEFCAAGAEFAARTGDGE